MDQHDIEPSRVVLIADDDAGLRVMIRAALEEDGWTVEEAEDGLSACAAFENVQPDIILLDVTMPRLDGFGACAQIRTLPGGDQAPVLMITGMDDEDSISRAYDVGATDFLSKPFNFRILRQRLHYMYPAKVVAAALQTERDFASAVVDTAGALVLVLDAEGRILRFNRACQLSSGYTLDEVKHRHAWEILSDEASADASRLLFEKLVADKETVHYEGTLNAKDGTTRAVTWSNALLTNDRGEVQNVVCTGLDVTDITEAKEKARLLASYDPLTGLPNRRLICDRIDQAISASEAGHCGQLAVLVIDLDRFKDINATLGRSAGDSVIKGVAERLTKSLRLSDVLSRSATSLRGELGRLGGDQFTVLVSGVVGASDVTGIIERLRRTFHRPFKIEGRDYSLTASFGATLCPTDGNETESLLRNAESAMYAARKQQRGTYHFYSPSMHKGVSERVTLESELRQAIDCGQLVLHYQPKVAGDTRRITGAEALVRWQHPSRGLMPAADFVHVAEESGLEVALGEWVLRAASGQVTSWLEAGIRPVPVAVNVSPAQFRMDNLLGTVMSVLNESSLDPAHLAFEITESVIMRDAHEATQLLERLRELGIHTIIDDFGTGDSTLSALKDLPVNTLKIDNVFVRDLSKSHEDKEVVKAVIAVAHGLGLTVAAEGVETDDQAAILTQVKCDELQGTLFGPPVPAEAFSTMIREQDDRHETPEHTPTEPTLVRTHPR